MQVLPSPNLHLRALALLLAGLILSAVAWGAVHASRPDKLPTLVWAPTLEAIVVMSKVDAVLEPLGAGWWWAVWGRAADPGANEPAVLPKKNQWQ